MSTVLQDATDLIEQGHLAKARHILADHIRANPRDEAAWLLMSACVDTPERQRQCLERVLQINPNNPHAIEGLKELALSHDDVEAGITDRVTTVTAPAIAVASAVNTCPYCKMEVPDGALVCPYCQKEISKAALVSNIFSKIGCWLMVLGCLLPILVIVIGGILSK